MSGRRFAGAGLIGGIGGRWRLLRKIVLVGECLPLPNKRYAASSKKTGDFMEVPFCLSGLQIAFQRRQMNRASSASMLNLPAPESSSGVRATR